MIPPGDLLPPDPGEPTAPGPASVEAARPLPAPPGPAARPTAPAVSVDTSDLWLCDACHSANELRVSHCYHCGAPRPELDDQGGSPADEGPGTWAAPGLGGVLIGDGEAPPRRRRRRRLVGVVAFVVVGALAVGAALAIVRPGAPSGPAATAPPSQAAVAPSDPLPSATATATAGSTTSSPSAALPGPAEIHAVGEQIDVLGIQTYSVARTADWPGSEPAPPGERYISALIRVTAGPDQVTKFDQGAFSVLDATGELRRARAGGMDPRLAYGTLEPGDTTSGWVTFQVADRGPFTLVYAMPTGQNGQVETTYVRLDPIPTPSPTPTPTPKPTPAPTPALSTTSDNFGFGAAYTSTYYAGYGAQRPGASVTRVEASWVQPAVSCSGNARSDLAVWVGIDDNGHRYLEQVGTAANCPAGTAGPRYYAWYEMFPSPAVPVDLTVHPGDRFSASVTHHGATWTLEIRNQTTGNRFTIDRKRTAKGLQALWIVEAPSTQSGGVGLHVLPLARFGHATLTAARAVVAGVRGDIDDPRWAHYRFVMRTTGGSLKAVVGDLTAGGSSFRATWRHR